MTGRRVLLVLGKELREAFRDRRTLFVTLVLPMLLYPALMIGLGTATVRQQGKLRDATQSMALQGPLPAALKDRLLDPARRLVEASPESPEREIRAGRLHLLVRAAPDFAEVLEAGGTARVELVHDSASEPSSEARRKAAAAVEEFRRAVLSERLRRRGIDPAFVDPVEVPAATTTDLATPAKRGAHAFGRILAMMLVIMVITGAFTPAVDAVAGEKERGTMETLLVCPATRVEVVLGKFASVFAVSLLTALGNLVSMGLTFGQFASSLGVRGKVDFSVDLGTAAVIFMVLLPLAALFTSLALALSTLARSTKEAQTYLTPLLLVAMPLSMVAVIPNIDLTPGLAATPIAGAVLLFRDLLLAQGEPELLARVLPSIPVVLGITVLAAGLSLRWAAWMFSREEVLFRDPGEPFTDSNLLAPGDLVKAWPVVLQQGLLIAGVVIGIAVAGLDARATLGLRLPGAAGVGAGLLLGCGAALATPWLTRAAGLAPSEEGTSEILKALVGGLGPVALVLLLGVLPAVAEEALFRGWCLSGYRSEMGGFASVLLSAVLFGAFHLEPERIAFTGALGLGLGFLALRTGSICPAILAHALHNGITVVFAKESLGVPAGAAPDALPFAARVLEGGSAGIGMTGLALAAAGIALVAVAPRRDSSPPGAPPG